MTPLDAALEYAATGLPIFPCNPKPGPGRNRPLTRRGFYDASRDPDMIRRWWSSWPDARIGMPTGRASGRWVLDIDVKRPEANGFDTLEDLGHALLPETPMAHTASGGLHVYFNAADRELKCSAGLLGPGLDVRGDGGYVIVPSPESGYEWDPFWNFDTVEPVPAPAWLWPPKPARPSIAAGPIKPVAGLSRYGERAIESACNAIAHAPCGEQERVLNAECFSIGTLAGAGAVPADIALRALLRAAGTMPDHDPRWPWRPEEIDLKVRRAFNAGLASPREARNAVA
jgi:bifunctional DNA primase/polymerase-like protein